MAGGRETVDESDSKPYVKPDVILHTVVIPFKDFDTYAVKRPPYCSFFSVTVLLFRTFFSDV